MSQPRFVSQAPSWSRRKFLGALGTVPLCLLKRARSAGDSKPDCAFLVMADTHFFANPEKPGQLDPRSDEITRQLVATLNKLPGSALPAAVGGGTALAPKGVLVLGDLINDGDKSGGAFSQMQQTEWSAFTTRMGLTGADGELKFPGYELHGNHDGPAGVGIAIAGIRARNKRRPDVTAISESGVHYAWQWGGVHFLNLGIVVAPGNAATARRRYNPLGSLDFLASYLRDKVGKSGQPVIVSHHCDIVRHLTQAALQNPPLRAEWDPDEIIKFYDTLEPYNVLGVFYGHTHNRYFCRWQRDVTGLSDTGVPVFNVKNASHYLDKNGAAYYCELAAGRLTVRELITHDRWLTSEWTPQVWTVRGTRA
ncbi:MAG: metallophosphoesterase [Kiritimatiellaeota bacterium]|nr:metallophosphoesterase [Kiritimatiellota bacterium]